MEEVREAIGLDKVNLSGKIIFIEEQHNSDANFVLHAVTAHCRDKNSITCFVLFHNTFGHFHNVGMKLGYDLRKACNSTVRVVEPFKILSKNIHYENAEEGSEKESLKFNIHGESKDIVKQLVKVIQDQCLSVIKEEDSQKVYIIIDDLSHLFDIGLDIQDVWLFIRYLRSLVDLENNLCFIVTSHVYKASQELCQPNLISLKMQYFADVVIKVQPLPSGYSRNVSGKMIIRWKSHAERIMFKWPEEAAYLFKLLDRQVKLFAPGSWSIM